MGDLITCITELNMEGCSWQWSQAGRGSWAGNIRPFIVLILVTGSNTFLSKIIIMLGLDVSSACLEFPSTTETKLNY